MKEIKLLYSTDRKILILDDHDIRIATLYVLWLAINARFKHAQCKRPYREEKMVYRKRIFSRWS
jgi:hypothetical protein